MGAHIIFCRRHTIRSRNDDIAHHVQAARYVQYRHNPLHLVALSAVGDQTVLESVHRPCDDQALVDCGNAAACGSGVGRCGIHSSGPLWLQGTLFFFWLMAFSSATHDIAADGFYMLGLDQHQQAWFVGIRSTFYRIATIFGQGLLVMLAVILRCSHAMCATHGVSCSTLWRGCSLPFGSTTTGRCHDLMRT